VTSDLGTQQTWQRNGTFHLVEVIVVFYPFPIEQNNLNPVKCIYSQKNWKFLKKHFDFFAILSTIDPDQLGSY